MIKTNEIRDMKKRNDAVRLALKEVVATNGLRWDFIAKQHLKISPSSCSQWKINVYDFGDQKLRVVESLIEKYNNMK